MNSSDIWELNHRHNQQQPDTTQRSIVAAARQRLEGVTTPENVIRVPIIKQEVTVLSMPQAMDGPQEWDKSSYIVTFRRVQADAPWEVERID